MAVSRTTAWVVSESAVRILDRATVRLLCLLIPGPVTDQASWARVIRHARCADGSLDPDQWFPVSAEAGKARQEAAAAIAIGTTCLVRAQCLALSRCGTGISASTVSGEAWSQQNARHCAAEAGELDPQGPREPLTDGGSRCGHSSPGGGGNGKGHGATQQCPRCRGHSHPRQARRGRQPCQSNGGCTRMGKGEQR